MLLTCGVMICLFRRRNTKEGFQRKRTPGDAVCEPGKKKNTLEMNKLEKVNSSSVPNSPSGGATEVTNMILTPTSLDSPPTITDAASVDLPEGTSSESENVERAQTNDSVSLWNMDHDQEGAEIGNETNTPRSPGGDSDVVNDMNTSRATPMNCPGNI